MTINPFYDYSSVLFYLDRDRGGYGGSSGGGDSDKTMGDWRRKEDGGGRGQLYNFFLNQTNFLYEYINPLKISDSDDKFHTAIWLQ